MRTAATAVLLIALAVMVLDLLVAQRVPLDHRFHWDGTYYLNYARAPFQIFWSRDIDPYSLSRIAPSLIVHLLVRVSGLDLSNQSILLGFSILNFACILAAIGIFYQLCIRLELSSHQLLLGCAALFLNFCFLKYNSFYPITTDVCSFTVGLAMLSAYLVGSTGALVLLTITGAFVWPLLPLIGAILIALPSEAASGQPRRATISIEANASRLRTRLLLGTASGLAVVAAASYVHYVSGFRHPGTPPLDWLAPLSIVVAGAYIGACVTLLIDPAFEIRRLIDHLPFYARRIALAGVVLALAMLPLWLLASRPPRNNPALFLQALLDTSTRAPGIFLVAHFAFFGPIVALASCCFTPLCGTIRRWGPGMVAVALLTIILSLGAESRQMMANLAFIAVPAIAAWRTPRRPRLFLLLFCAIALATSRVWIILDLDRLEFTYESYLQYPWQWFFGAIGYWMTWDIYLIHLGGLLATLIAVMAFRSEADWSAQEPTRRELVEGAAPP
ncbi:MAG: hypothetical protein M5U07_25190 [Xanthobacteraceae bacterium]|nr:hypothetical protein [Xanthobacteraceae bacterium]